MPPRSSTHSADTRTLVLCGGGSGSHVLAADIGRRPGWRVRVLTSRPESWADHVECVEQLHRSDRYPVAGVRRLEYRGAIEGAFGWERAGEALRGADVVVLVCPVHAHRPILERVVPELPRDRPVLLGSLFAQGGFDWILRELDVQLPPEAALFGLKRYPFLCKAGEYGRRVELFGRFPQVVAAVDAPGAELRARAIATLGELLQRPVLELPSFLPCALNMSNQLLHPGIAWGHFHDYVPGQTVYPRQMRFYGDLNRRGVQAMEAIYRDLVALTRELARFTGLPLLEYLGIDPMMRWAVSLRMRVLHRRGIDGLGPLRYVEELFGPLTFRLNRRLNRILAPMIPAPGGHGFIPNVSSRFWADDIPHGLCVLAGLGRTLQLPTPRIDALIRGHQAIMGHRYLIGDELGPDFADTGAPQRYGVHDRAGLRALLSAPLRPDRDRAPSASRSLA
ncbi:MAG: NAD/NADP octopine/nopaline dehydrogenase family protein [Myxococcales bacterium]|nr:NAD/NADP octopine/nopaline dehydrogenase family protein [Myxococcales bacterium]